MKPLATILLCALAYYAGGKLGIYLAIPPGYATAVWPSSGIALALTLRFGWICLPGILLGSYFVNVSITGGLHQPNFHDLILPLIIAGGAALQTAIGWKLVKRHLETLWSSLPSLLWLLLLGGPLSCLLAATIGVSSLLLFGKITSGVFFDIWLTWWVGDTLGVLTFTPAVMVMLATSEQVGPTRRLIIVVPLIAIFSLATLAYSFVRDFEQNQRRQLVQQKMQQLSYTLQLNIRTLEEVMQALSSFLENEGGHSLAVFNGIAHSYQQRYASIQALEWVPIVAEQERVFYERSMRANGYPQFQFSQLDALGNPQPITPRDVYYPVYYIVPAEGNEKALGLDLGSEARRFRALMSAANSESAILSEPLGLVQLETNNKGYLLVKSLSETWFGARDHHNSSFLVLVFIADELMQLATQGLALEELNISLYEVGRDHDTPLIVSGGGLTEFQASQEIAILNRYWRIEVTPNLEFLRRVPQWQSYSVLFSSWLFVSLLGVLLIGLTGRQTTIERIVKEQTAELVQARDQAQRASRAKSDFLASMSHELRTPLNSIIGFTNQLLLKKSDNLDARTLDSLETVKRNGQHLLSLINNLLDIAKIEAGKLELDKQRFELNALCRELISQMRSMAQQEKKRVEIRLQQEPNLMLLADRQRIYQMLLNLLANALKFTKVGQITLSISQMMYKEIPCIQFQVSDTGMGISEAEQEHLFEKFYQASEGKRRPSGTGLGLALVKEIVELHRGEITLTSSLGQGCSFTIWIPIN